MLSMIWWSKNNIKCQSELNNARTEIETLKLELENKDKTLNECMNENIALKLSNNEKLSIVIMIVQSMIIDNIERSMHKSLAIIVEEKDIYHIIFLLIRKVLLQ